MDMLPSDVMKYTTETEHNGSYLAIFYCPAFLLWTNSAISAFLLVHDTLRTFGPPHFWTNLDQLIFEWEGQYSYSYYHCRIIGALSIEHFVWSILLRFEDLRRLHLATPPRGGKYFIWEGSVIEWGRHPVPRFYIKNQWLPLRSAALIYHPATTAEAAVKATHSPSERRKSQRRKRKRRESEQISRLGVQYLFACWSERNQ